MLKSTISGYTLISDSVQVVTLIILEDRRRISRKEILDKVVSHFGTKGEKI